LTAPFRTSRQWQGAVVSRPLPVVQWPELLLARDPADRWKVAAIKNGRSFETARKDRVIDFWAVDPDTLTVYYHHESGGFPTDPPSTQQRWTRR